MQLPECKQTAQPGHLYIVATPIGNLGDLTLRAASILNSCDLIACEDTRVTHGLLHYLGIKKPTLSYRDANEKSQAESLIGQLKEGKSVALVSDAGTPTLSDPGFRVVRESRKLGISVVPIPGASALLAAISASGLPSNDFRFVGFLPPKSAARKRFFTDNKDSKSTLALYESSHRIQKFIDELIEVLGRERVVCIAREITKLHETFLVGCISEVYEQFQTRSQKGEFVVLIAPQDFQL